MPPKLKTTKGKGRAQAPPSPPPPPAEPDEERASTPEPEPQELAPGETAAEPSAATKKRRGCQQGASNFTEGEDTTLLTLMEQIRPGGSVAWDLLAERYNAVWTENTRTVESLRARWEKLLSKAQTAKGKAAGSAELSALAERTLEVWATFKKRNAIRIVMTRFRA
ncbi:hypothetical protein FRC08_016103 [Ceratobasidium sp. 394]|nr:hypothetical protein FRC08_016103 [Ceratobasidium sp. 394]